MIEVFTCAVLPPCIALRNDHHHNLLNIRVCTYTYIEMAECICMCDFCMMYVWICMYGYVYRNGRSTFVCVIVVCMYGYVCMDMYIEMVECMRVCVCVCGWVCVYTCIFYISNAEIHLDSCTCMYMHACIHTYIHTKCRKASLALKGRNGADPFSTYCSESESCTDRVPPDLLSLAVFGLHVCIYVCVCVPYVYAYQTSPSVHGRHVSE
jgi:hypothetical protein